MVQIVATVSLIFFIVLMVGIGIFSIRRASSLDGFLLGGRNIGPWLSAFAYGTSYFSAVIFIGYAGMHGWNIGLPSMWIGVGNALIGSLLAWVVLARKTRRMTHRLDARTMPEFFSARYDSRPMKIYTAAIIFIFLVPYAASVYKGLGTMFSAIYGGADPLICMLIVAILTGIYLVLGGYVATALTDFIQGLVMVIGILMMIGILVTRPEVGGLTQVIPRLAAIDPQLVNITGGSNSSFLMINILLTSLGVWGLPQMVHKYYAIKDESNIRLATIISTAFCVIISVGAYFTGSLSKLFLQAQPNGMPDVVGGYDNVMPTLLMQALSQSVFSMIVLSVILLLLLSASMSTLAAVVLSSSSAVSVDLIGEVHPNIQEKSQMRLLRFLCLIFVALSYLFAAMNISFIVNLMSFSWGVVAGSFIGPFIWGLYWKGTTKAGAWAGLLSGIVVVGGLLIYNCMTIGFTAAKSFAPQFGVAAMVVSIVIVPIVSLITKKYSAEHVENAFSPAE